MNQELTEQEIKERLGEEAYEEQENIMMRATVCDNCYDPLTQGGYSWSGLECYSCEYQFACYEAAMEIN